MNDNDQQCVVAEYTSIEAADLGCKVLETANFNNETVSIITRNTEQRTSELAGLKDDTAGSPPAQESVGIGGALGGSVGAALGAATLIGPLLVVGPLVGIAVGAGMGGLAAAVNRWGITEDKTNELAQRVQAGNVVLIVTDTRFRLDEAERLLKTTGPKSLERYQVAE